VAGCSELHRWRFLPLTVMQGALFLCLLSFWAKKKEFKAPNEDKTKACRKPTKPIEYQSGHY
jgi:hypothetical protein